MQANDPGPAQTEQYNAAPAAWRQRAVLVAAVTAIAIRAIALSFGEFEPYSSIRETYFATAAGLASGNGYITETLAGTRNNNGFDEPTTVVQYMKARESEGGRVDREHPFPRSTQGWAPGTRHPFGYGTLVYVYYSLLNYRGTLWALHITQIFADSLACLMVFAFARNVFGAGVGVVAAWLYALCPPMIFLCQDLIPDAFHGFFIASVLALASRVPKRGLQSALLAGATLGLACYFRTEYILLPGALFVAFWATSRKLTTAIVSSAGLTASMLFVLLPWALWNRSVIGQFRFTTTTGGGGLYECLGEDPNNAWGIVFDDSWISDDASKRGLGSPWGPEADAFYKAKFKEYVLKYPRSYAGIVLKQRLPLALAPPYDTGKRTTRDEFNFTMYKTSEGLTRWGVVKKYPLRVLKYMWPQVAMLGYSAMLTLCVFFAVVTNLRELGRAAWVFMPWFYTVASISLFKGIEARNLAPTIVPAVVAMAYVGVTYAARFRDGKPEGART